MTDQTVQGGASGTRTAASQKRRRDILLAGKRVFFESGYQLASVDRIAEVAGTTKRTVYDHFGSKEALFSDVIAFACAQFVSLLPKVESLPANPAEGIRLFATRTRELVSSPDIIRFQRLVLAEAERHPALGHALYETAVLGAERLLADYLQRCVDQGRLKAHDVQATARVILDTATNMPRMQGLLAADNFGDDPVTSTALTQLLDMVIDRISV